MQMNSLENSREIQNTKNHSVHGKKSIIKLVKFSLLVIFLLIYRIQSFS